MAQVSTSSLKVADQALSPAVDGGRVLLVGGGQHEALDNLATQLAGRFQVTRVDNVLEALGDIAAQGQPAQIIGSLEQMADDLEPAIAAVKRLAPGTRLSLIGRADSRELQSRALLAGADVCQLEPVKPEAFTVPSPMPGSIGGGEHDVDAVAQEDRYASCYTLVSFPGPALETKSQSAVSVVWAPGDVPAHESGGCKPSLTCQELAAQADWSLLRELEALSVVGSIQASVQPCDQDLGDVDLLDHLLSHRQGVADLLLRLAAARSGKPQAQWTLTGGNDPVCAQAQIPPGRRCCAIRWNDRFFGILHALPQVDEATLRAWADWMARWLALEARLGGLWDLALRDELTGVWNRRYFHRFLETLLRRAATDRFQVTLMVFDIDDFKLYNDRFGHAAGDEILREAARLMRSVVRSHDVVARIGGDEFAVIFWDAQGPRRPHSHHPDDVRQAAGRFQKAIVECRFPRLLDQARGTLTISGGLAGFPWDGRTPSELLERADAMCLQSKQQGKNVLTFGPGAARRNPESA